MTIQTPNELANAVQEFQRLRDAAQDSPEAQRRDELDAEIKAYYAEHAGDLRKAKPPKE